MIVPFKPQLHSDDLTYLLRHDLNPGDLDNTELHSLVKELTEKAHPSKEEEFDIYWENFYLPVRRDGRRITVPLWITKYNGRFFPGCFSYGSANIGEGNKNIDKKYFQLFEDAIEFAEVMKKDPKIIQKTTPYDLRMGKILGKHCLEEVIPQKTKQSILKAYAEHVAKQLTSPPISFQDYLNTAAICYKTANKRPLDHLTPLEMYHCFADGRDDGVREIDHESVEEYAKWIENNTEPNHAFEMIKSGSGGGVYLYPPGRRFSEDKKAYGLSVDNLVYAEKFIKIARELIKHEIPFRSDSLKDVLDVIAGDTYFTVNRGSRNECFNYYPSKENYKNYFHHIEWDPLKLLKMR